MSKDIVLGSVLGYGLGYSLIEVICVHSVGSAIAFGLFLFGSLINIFMGERNTK